ncbi:hypothetical protein LC653_23505 [Nostoc sp. CHAB 5784]|uniref:hypothetical protein n=1 Tax=Nostoc mirabile TaxID=2907820 RepID=UPI001E476F16|nr:hypothetical protein [Nostoc mirabile]MCC5666775.1 hypothetical protein [Nostoc mirabile CHAB5784]
MAPVSDIFLLQDLTGSFIDDLPNLKDIFPSLVDNLKNPNFQIIYGADPFFGVASFKDKPVGGLGDPGDFVYRNNIALTGDTVSVISTVNGLSADGGGDLPEAQLEALLQLSFSPNYRSDSTRIALVVTDADFHKPPDGANASPTITRPNNGDNVVDADEDYPTIVQLKDRLVASNIIPVFLVTPDVVSFYEQLVIDLGRGEVIGLDRTSITIADAIKFGVASARGIITESGTPEPNTIDLSGSDSDEIVFSGSGNDGVTGGNGNDYIDAGAGDDFVDGGDGEDTLDGGTGGDIGRGGGGDDFVIDGLSGNDIYDGGAGNDTIIGGPGIDNLIGGEGDDNLQGDRGNDILTGGIGNDNLQAGDGDDNLKGDSGNDILIGGAGSDIFVFDSRRAFISSDLGVDQISDFSSGTDKIRLSKKTFTALDNTSNSELIGSNFAVVAVDSLAGDNSAEIVYSSSSGNLFYNENNNAAGFGSGGLFATIVGSPVSLLSSDFFVFAV